MGISVFVAKGRGGLLVNCNEAGLRLALNYHFQTFFKGHLVKLDVLTWGMEG